MNTTKIVRTIPDIIVTVLVIAGILYLIVRGENLGDVITEKEKEIRDLKAEIVVKEETCHLRVDAISTRLDIVIEHNKNLQREKFNEPEI